MVAVIAFTARVHIGLYFLRSISLSLQAARGVLAPEVEGWYFLPLLVCLQRNFPH